jgi:hypothetical protein
MCDRKPPLSPSCPALAGRLTDREAHIKSTQPSPNFYVFIFCLRGKGRFDAPLYCGQLWRSAPLSGCGEMGGTAHGDPPIPPIYCGGVGVVRNNLIICLAGRMGGVATWRMPVVDRCAPQPALSAVG